MNKNYIYWAFVCVIVSFLCACAPKKASVYFSNIQNGAQLKAPFKVIMGAEGITVSPAGELKENTGHHHILIDRGPFPEGQVIPTNEKHIHFGGGQKETELKLSLGKHKITLQFADGIHRSYGPRLSSTIEINVIE